MELRNENVWDLFKDFIVVGKDGESKILDFFFRDFIKLNKT